MMNGRIDGWMDGQATHHKHISRIKPQNEPQKTNNRSACFTKAYKKFIKGTGSVVYQRFDGQAEEAVVLHVGVFV